MINYIRNRDIDKVKWDRCIELSANGRIFAYSWFLDRMSNQWDGIVEEDYKSVFPLTWNRKFGIHYLYQPFFTQQLGIFSTERLTPERITEFLDSIPRRFRYIDISLNITNLFQSDRYTTFENKTHELDLNREYGEIEERYSENTRRNIRKSGAHNLTLTREDKSAEFIALFRDNLGKSLPKIKGHHYARLYSLMQEGLTRRIGESYGVFSVENKLCAGAYFIYSDNRYIFLFSANNQESREKGAMFLLLDQFIRDHAGEDCILDFMGSNDENLARFYRGFGSSETYYPSIKMNNLPWPVRWFKK